MKITQTVASTLLVAITEAIQGGSLTKYGSFKFDDDWSKQALAAIGDDFSKALSKALDGSTLESFLTDRLRAKIIESGIQFPTERVNISKIDCFSEPLTVARSIVKDLEGIPNQYRFVVRVFDELAERIKRDDIDITLNDRLQLVSGAKIPGTFKIKHENDRLDTLLKRSVSSDESDLNILDDRLYLQYRSSGYLTSRRSSRTVSEFFDEVRAFYGVCIAYAIMAPYPYGGELARPILIANKVQDGVEELAYVDLPEDDIIKCAGLATTKITDDKIDEGEVLEDILKPVMSVFKSSNATKLKTACAWALRAHLSKRGLDKILESAITIEVLMGDRDTSDRIGLSKLIANRCAYALGKSNAERDRIVEFFVQFYRVRSEVVHSGRTSLHADERKIVNEGLDLANRILKHEISLSR